MKNILFIIVILVLIFCMLAGCGKAEQLDTNAIDEPNQPDVLTEASNSSSAGNKATSDELFSFKISFDGTIIQIPCKVSELIALGYSFYNDDGDEMMEGDDSMGATLRSKNDKSVSVGIRNPSLEPQNISECLIYEIKLYEGDVEGQNFQLINGIAFGNTIDDIRALYGEPGRDDIADSCQYITYFAPEEEDDVYFNSIQFGFYDGALAYIDITNFGKKQ